MLAPRPPMKSAMTNATMPPLSPAKMYPRPAMRGAERENHGGAETLGQKSRRNLEAGERPRKDGLHQSQHRKAETELAQPDRQHHIRRGQYTQSCSACAPQATPSARRSSCLLLASGAAAVTCSPDAFDKGGADKGYHEFAPLVDTGRADREQAEIWAAFGHARLDHLALIMIVSSTYTVSAISDRAGRAPAPCRRPARRDCAPLPLHGGVRRPSSASRSPRCANRRRPVCRNASARPRLHRRGTAGDRNASQRP